MIVLYVFFLKNDKCFVNIYEIFILILIVTYNSCKIYFNEGLGLF